MDQKIEEKIRLSDLARGAYATWRGSQRDTSPLDWYSLSEQEQGMFRAICIFAVQQSYGKTIIISESE